MSGCCEDKDAVVGREDATSSDTGGVFNGDCLLNKSGGVSSTVYNK
jgi:hypothetical protein